MVNLVIVSHSARLGEGVGELAQQMLMGGDCKIAVAAGIDDAGHAEFGTFIVHDVG